MAWQWFDSGGWHPSARDAVPGDRVSLAFEAVS